MNPLFGRDINELRQNVYDLKQNDDKLANTISENRNIIENLNEKIVYLEKSIYHNMQHGRLSNIEIDGNPTNIGDDRKQLEEAAIKILNAINVKCSPEDIEAIHRLPAKTGIKPTIVKFLSRKTAENSLENKGKLKYLNKRLKH